MNWKGIVIHHSGTDDDSIKSDWDNLRKFHMSWRLGNKIITPEEAHDMMEDGVSGIEPPWKNIGYHFGVESQGSEVKVKLGRSLKEEGAHCKGNNDTMIGICCIGDFDKESPSDVVYYVCALICIELMHVFDISISNIYRHGDFSKKTCPGNLFDMDRFKKYVRCCYSASDIFSAKEK